MRTRVLRWALLTSALAVGAPSSLPATLSREPSAAPVANRPFVFSETMVPMRDGAKLQTVILTPTGRTGPLPILLSRSPYGVPSAAPDEIPQNLRALMGDGYIVVIQSMRGRFKSGGIFGMSTFIDARSPKAVNEVTDSYDTVEWLVRNVPGNNGKVGLRGVSYAGLTAAIALLNPHPAVKAASPQAAWVDWWMNDDLHRYGALRLSYAVDWPYMLQHRKTENASFSYDRYDTYDWFLKLGPLSNLQQGYFRGHIPAWTALVEHPDYDLHWKAERWIDKLEQNHVPVLNVVGFWDQEDPWGSWQIYRRLERTDIGHINSVVAGPWNHGGWTRRADRLGLIPLGGDTSDYFLTNIEAPFFRYWLHGKGPRPDREATVFQTGTNVWKTYPAWPPPATVTALYLHTDGSLSFRPPLPGGASCREYVSDPASPVPYRARPISPTYPGGDWPWWEAADQRFADGRPDVLTYTSAPLDDDIAVSGEVSALLFASTSGTDSDFVVKLIDVFPENAQSAVWDEASGPAPGDYSKSLNSYQLPIAMEIRRGRWLGGFERAAPLRPGKIVAWPVPLRDRNHVFRKGHRIMVQIQSSWFPVIDRNPQSFVPNIFRAKKSDFRRTVQRVCSSPSHASRLILPIASAGHEGMEGAKAK